MAYATKIKLLANQAHVFNALTKVERWSGKYGDQITVSDGTTEFAGSVGMFERQFGRYSMKPEEAVGHAWRFTRLEDGKLLDVDLMVKGMPVTPAEYAAGALPAPAKAQAAQPDADEFDDFLDPPPPGADDYPPQAASPAPLAKTAPQAAKASPESVAAVKATLRPDQQAERDRIVTVYGEAMRAAKDIHATVSDAGRHYHFDGSAIQATAFTIHKMWADAGLVAK